jgi:hypothetical protein
MLLLGMQRTVCEIADGQSLRRLGDIPQRDISLAFSDHQMHDDQRFENYCPCRVTQSQL